MKCFKILIILYYLIIQLIKVQGFIDVTLLDFDTTVVNKEYLSDVEIYINDNNIGMFVNMTIIKDLPKSTMFTYELIGATLGEYIVKTGIKYTMLFCNVFQPQFRFLGDQFKMIGINENNCLPKPNTYGHENMIFDMKCFPDTFRSNQYVAIASFHAELTTLMEFKLYFRIN